MAKGRQATNSPPPSMAGPETALLPSLWHLGQAHVGVRRRQGRGAAGGGGLPQMTKGDRQTLPPSDEGSSSLSLTHTHAWHGRGPGPAPLPRCPSAGPTRGYLAGRLAAHSGARRGPGQACAGGAEVGGGHVLLLQAAARRVPHAEAPVRPGERQEAPLAGGKRAGRPRHEGGGGEGRRRRHCRRASVPTPCRARRGPCACHGARSRPGPLRSQQASGRPHGSHVFGPPRKRTRLR